MRDYAERELSKLLTGNEEYTCTDSFIPVTFPYEVPTYPEKVYLTGDENKC